MTPHDSGALREFAAEDDPFMEASPPGLIVDAPFRAATNKKADVAEHREVFGHVGLLVDKPPGPAGLPFVQSSDDI